MQSGDYLWKLISRLSVLSLVVLAILQGPLPTTHAQAPIQILCDASFDKTQDLRPPPGTVYRRLSTEEGLPLYQVERITQAGSDIIEIPLPSDLDGKVNIRSVSPDGRYIALTPANYDIPLVIWKVGTQEFATTLLPDEFMDLFAENIRPMRHKQQILTWTDNSHLRIQYLDLDAIEYYAHVQAEQFLTIVDEPFQIVTGPKEDIEYPTIIPPEQSVLPRQLYSPQHNYVTLVSSWIRNRFQVYDLHGEQPLLVADLQPDDTHEFVDVPVWTPDESQFFAVYAIPEAWPYRRAVLQVNAEEGFQITHDLQTSLEAVFGSNMTLAIAPISRLNATGHYYVLHIGSRELQQSYLVFYHLQSGNITAICDPGDVNPEYYYPVWVPNDDYFGYIDNGWFTAYNIGTGEGYRTTGVGFIGWVIDEQAATVNTRPDQSLPENKIVLLDGDTWESIDE